MLPSILSTIRPLGGLAASPCRAASPEKVFAYEEQCWLEKNDDGMTLLRCRERRRVLLSG
jgi:hypothetical protein